MNTRRGAKNDSGLQIEGFRFLKFTFLARIVLSFLHLAGLKNRSEVDQDLHDLTVQD